MISHLTCLLDRADLNLRVEQALAAFLAGKRPQLAEIDPRAFVAFMEVIERHVLHGEDRFGPVFALWAHRGAGGKDDDDVVGAIAALELVQAGALIHRHEFTDPRTPRRRPSVPELIATLHPDAGAAPDPASFGSSMAIILGHMYLVWADELLDSTRLSPAVMARVTTLFGRIRREMIIGEYLDRHAHAVGDLSLDRAVLLAQFSTVDFSVEHSMLIGAAIAGASDPIMTAYFTYGVCLGIALRIENEVSGIWLNCGT